MSAPRPEPATAIVYALTSHGCDIYSEQTFVSASLLRRLYPAATILLLVDEQTGPALRGVHDPVVDLANDVVVVKTGLTKPVERNRWLKTTMRQHLTGPFVYLDADVLAIRPFDEVFGHDDDVAGVNDYTEGLWGLRRPRWVRSLYRTFEWAYPPRQYLNGGVLYMADRPTVHEFARHWHEGWRQCVDRANLSLDQPSLNRALDTSGVRVRVLSERFNCPVNSAIWPVRRSRIFHYFSSQVSDTAYTLLDHLLRHLQHTGEIDWPAVERAATTGDPYVAPPPLIKHNVASGRYARAASLAARRIVDRGRPNAPEVSP